MRARRYGSSSISSIRAFRSSDGVRSRSSRPRPAEARWSRSRSHDRFGFTVTEEDRATRSVPYHRVRAVWREGELIWSRRPR
ncbi:MAG: RNA repair domain-containing protein [Betaproteobacteria bacterium]